MNKIELEKRTETIISLLAIWNFSKNEDMVSSYVTATRNVPADVLEEVCDRLKSESENKPAPVVIIRMADAIMEERQRERMKNEMPKKPILFGDIIRAYNQAKENGCTLTIYEFTIEYRKKMGAKDGTGNR